MGGSPGKEVGIGGRVSELPPVVVVPGGVGKRAHSTTLCAELEDNRHGSSNRKGSSSLYTVAIHQYYKERQVGH